MLKSTSKVGGAPTQSEKKKYEQWTSETPSSTFCHLPLINWGCDQKTKKKHSTLSFDMKNKLKALGLQPTQAVHGAWNLSTKKKFSLEAKTFNHFPLFPPELRPHSANGGSCARYKATISVFSPRIPTDIWLHLEMLQIVVFPRLLPN